MLTFCMLFASLLSLYGSMYQQLCMHVFLWPLCMHQPGSFRKFDSGPGTTHWGSLDQALPPSDVCNQVSKQLLGQLNWNLALSSNQYAQSVVCFFYGRSSLEKLQLCQQITVTFSTSAFSPSLLLYFCISVAVWQKVSLWLLINEVWSVLLPWHPLDIIC